MRSFGKLPALVGAILAASSTFAQQPAYHPTKADIAQADLFMALTANDFKGVKAALDAGADPNKRDFIDMAPIFFAQDARTAQLLLSKGARFNEVTTKGTVLINALVVGQDKAAAGLLTHGADPMPVRSDGTNALMYAAETGCLDSIRLMIKMKVPVNLQSKEGMTALMFAARENQLQAAKLLLAAGANVNISDSMKRTALHYAAQSGLSSMSALLVAHGARVNCVDRSGSTPLHLAACYSPDIATIHTLLASGARKTTQDGRGKTACDLATTRGFSDAAKLVAVHSTWASPRAARYDAATISASIKPALNLIQSSMETYRQKAACVSCHHQGLGVVALTHAANRGLTIRGSLLANYLQQIGDDCKDNAGPTHIAAADLKMAKMIPSQHLGDLGFMEGYLLEAYRCAGIPQNGDLADAATVLLQEQKPDGSWEGGNRGTMQHSDVTHTSMMLNVLTTYLPKARKSDLNRSKAKAKAWALSMKPKGADDLASRLLVLKAAGATPAEVAAATHSLFAAQKPDGGWGLPNRPFSDAYTTGLSLYALRSAAGVPTQNDHVRRAVAYLLRTQDADGSWFVKKVTVAFNNHFDTGFPHGYDQYASFAGTCWAVIGLMEVLPLTGSPES